MAGNCGEMAEAAEAEAEGEDEDNDEAERERPKASTKMPPSRRPTGNRQGIAAMPLLLGAMASGCCHGDVHLCLVPCFHIFQV